jgi:hypothetical protein
MESCPPIRFFWIIFPPLSLADYCFNQAIKEMDIESTNLCPSFDSFLSIPFPSTFPILNAFLEHTGSFSVDSAILFDARASTSFIDFQFACRNHLHLTPLTHTIQFHGFDGTLAKLGNIHSCWQGHIHFPAKSFSIQPFPVLLLVTDLALANVILGFPWLSENQIFVGRLPKNLLVPKSLSLSEKLA